MSKKKIKWKYNRKKKDRKEKKKNIDPKRKINIEKI